MTRQPFPWLTAAAPCLRHDPSLWDDDRASDTAMAKVICGTCPLTAACLAHALNAGEHGVWGGTSEKDRRRLGSTPALAPERPEHGTATGARQHYRRGEKPCEACRIADSARRATEKERKRSA